MKTKPKKPGELAERMLADARFAASRVEDKPASDMAARGYWSGLAYGYWFAARMAAIEDGLNSAALEAWAGESPHAPAPESR